MKVFGVIQILAGIAAVIFARQIHQFNMRIFPLQYRYWSPKVEPWRIRICGIFLFMCGLLLLIVITRKGG
jgi:hypothetical protein